MSSRYGAIRRGVNRKREKAGLPPVTFTFHDLRHVFAVEYLRGRKGSIYDLQKTMGHASVKQTEAYLAFLTPEEERIVKAVAQNPAQ